MPESLTWMRLKIAVIVYLGGKCNSSSCRWQNDDMSYGCDDVRILQVDHIKGDGPDDRLLHKKKESTLKGNPYGMFNFILSLSILEAKKRYQILCPNCNWLKRYMNKEFRKNAAHYKMKDKCAAIVSTHIPESQRDLVDFLLKRSQGE